jgi:hypothetical protein
MAAGRPIQLMPSYRTGVRLRWFLGDLDSLLAVLLRSSNSLNLPPQHPDRLTSLIEFFKPGRDTQRNEVFRLDDPCPALLELCRWLTRR